MLAARIGESAEVNLRVPPPLDRSLDLVAEDSTVKLVDGDRVVADGTSWEGEVTVPEPPSIDDARTAVNRYVGFWRHPFPECFTCGPHRDHHDGLNVFPGKVDGTDVVASPWTPDPSLPSVDGQVTTVVVWAALACPTGFGCQWMTEGKAAVLARLRAHLIGPVRIGAPYIAIGWPVGRDGRKHEGGSAIFTVAGELVAYASGLWIELKE